MIWGYPYFWKHPYTSHLDLLLHVLSVGGDSLTKPPFRVTSAEVVIIYPDRMTATADCRLPLHMNVSKNTGIPKWTVLMENPIKVDDLGLPLFLETPIYLTPRFVVTCALRWG